MALIKSDIGEISGTIGGKVYARNRGGQYVKQWAKPTNPNTPNQQRARSDFASAVAVWAALSPAQRVAWDTYAQNVAMTNRLGETVYLTGQQHFVRSYSAMLVASLTPVADGPTVFSLPDPGDITIEFSAATGQCSVTYDDSADWCSEDNAALLVLVSDQKAATINYYKGPYVLGGTIDGDSVSPPTSPGTVPGSGAYTALNKGFAQIRLIRADGRVSTPIRVGGVVVP